MGKYLILGGFDFSFDLILIPSKLLGLNRIVYNSKHGDFTWQQKVRVEKAWFIGGFRDFVMGWYLLFDNV